MLGIDICLNFSVFTDCQVQITCPSRPAVLQCEDNSRTSLNWRLKTNDNVIKLISFNGHFDNIGTTRLKFFGSSQAQGKLVRKTNRSISSSLTIDASLLPLLNSVTCNEEEVHIQMGMSWNTL